MLSLLRRSCAVIGTSLLTLGAPAVIGLSPAAALAQTAGAPARFVVPTADGVYMRCKEGTAWYPVATLTQRTILRVISESNGWVRVAYPQGTPAAVRTDEAELNEAQRSVTLTRRTQLRAFNPANPTIDESFASVMEEALLPGTELRYLSTIKDNAGNPGGYLVEPPAGATGWVLVRELREATPTEIERAGAPAAAPAVLPTTPPPAPTTTALPQPVPASGAPSSPVSTPPATTGGPADAGALPAQPTDAAPGATAPAGGPVDLAAAAQPAPRPKAPTLRQLDRAFEDLQRQPIEQTDPQELIEQYHALDDSLPDAPQSKRVREAIDARVEVLRLRAEARGMLPDIQALQRSADDAASRYSQTVDRLVQNREYVAVGRLAPSTLYDGVRLPLMYRLISLDASLGRTIAYITPGEGLDLDQKIGAIVGVLGEGTIEPSSMVNILVPATVDVLRGATSTEVQGTSEGQPR